MPLSLTATGPRNILSGEEFNRFFTAKAVYGDPIIKRDGSVEDAVSVMSQVATRYKSDTALLAPYLAGGSVEQTCHNIWNFIYTYIQYREDDPGVEQIRRPLRTWLDRSQGADCDCMAVFASSILLNLHIPHYFRITKYGKPDFQHVYVIVPKSGTGQYYTIDGVIDAYNKEKTFTSNKDFNAMNGIPIHVLNGLGDANSQDDQQLYSFLVDTRSLIEQNPATVQDRICPCDAVPMLSYVIDNWSDAHSRSLAIEKVAETEKQRWPELNFFQTMWHYMEGSASIGQVKAASYVSGGLNGIFDYAFDPTLNPTLYANPAPPVSTSGASGNWWANWGSGVSSFMGDLLKTGLQYDIAKNTPVVKPTATSTTTLPPGYIAPTQAGMSTGSILLTVGVLAAIGAAAYTMTKKKPAKGAKTAK